MNINTSTHVFSLKDHWLIPFLGICESSQTVRKIRWAWCCGTGIPFILVIIFPQILFMSRVWDATRNDLSSAISVPKKVDNKRSCSYHSWAVLCLFINLFFLIVFASHRKTPHAIPASSLWDYHLFLQFQITWYANLWILWVRSLLYEYEIARAPFLLFYLLLCAKYGAAWVADHVHRFVVTWQWFGMMNIFRFMCLWPKF